MAMRLILSGDADAMVTGGTEASVTALTIAGFANMKALSQSNEIPERASRPFDKDRDGFVLGEGSGMLVIERESHAKNRGAHILAELAGYGSTDDAFHITQPSKGGSGALKAMERAITDAGLNLDDIDYINAHGTSTPYNDKNESAAILEQTLPPTINYDTPDPECTLDYVPNIAQSSNVNSVLSNTFGFGGHNAVICIRKYN